MRFGLFYEHQMPRPWEEGAEEQLLDDALEQVELADRLGIDHVWEVEHHFLEEYSHSSAPEVFLAAASQRTRDIRLGHGIVQLPPAINHPARVAERVATLDLLSHGRVDFGTGEASSQAELGGFGVARGDKREQWEESLDVVTRMLTEEPFTGHRGRWVDVPPRNVVPKPKQRPHPPLWVACSRRETIEMAARKGMGALSFSFVEPEDAKPWVESYYRILASEECVPAGLSVNPNLAVVVPLMIHEDEETAIERGIDGAHFFGYSLAHYYVFGEHVPGHSDVWAEFDRDRRQRGFARDLIKAQESPLSMKVLQEGVGSLRGAVGTPAQVADLVRRYEAVGVDQVIFVAQAGTNRHEHVCESLELFADQVLPEFAEHRDEQDARKEERLADAVEAAQARRPRRAPTEAADRYVIQPTGELRAAATDTGVGATRPEIDLRGRIERTFRRGVGTFVDRVSDERLERMGPRVAGALFRGWGRAGRPTEGAGGTDTVQFDLRSDGEVHSWTVRSDEHGVSVTKGGADQPDAVLRTELVDFLRITAGRLPAGKALFDDRLEIEGDLGALSRVVGTIAEEDLY